MAKTIVSELKDLAVKMGADPDDLKAKRTTAAMIDEIEQLVDGGSGGGVLMVEVVPDFTNHTFTTDTEFKALQDAYAAGMGIEVVFKNGEGPSSYNLKHVGLGGVTIDKTSNAPSSFAFDRIESDCGMYASSVGWVHYLISFDAQSKSASKTEFSTAKSS